MSLVLTDDHRYFLNGVEVIGCTDTLASVGLLDKRYYTDEGSLRGTAVHACIRDCFERRRKPEKRIRGFVEGAFRFLDDTKAEPLHVEFSLADDALLIAGTTDLIAYVTLKSVAEPRFAIIDWKTGQPEAWHRFQLAWYEQLARANKLVEGLVERIVVHLKDDGTYAIRTCRDRNDWKVADAARIVEQAKRAA